jgi:OOP family OmpA-OmpF porin
MQRELVLQGIEFEYDSAEINPSSEPVLRVAAQMLIDNPDVRVEIGGHTDDQGTPSYNLELSQARAQSVANWLQGHGVEGSRLEVQGYGQTQPIVPNDSEENRARNRRIEFKQIIEQ